MDLVKLRKFETLGPFEIKDELISLAKKTSRTTQSSFLNAGRGNPNWIATTPREGFFLLGQFAVTESKRVMEHPAGVGGMSLILLNTFRAGSCPTWKPNSPNPAGLVS